MEFNLVVDPNKLYVYIEIKKRRIFVGELNYLSNQNKYKFIYDKRYINSKKAIPLGKELSLFKITHSSEKNNLFPSFLDRIPDKENPAYKDYCISQGIDINETNLIILLGTIGRKGPSSFIFEKVYKTNFSINDVKKLRNNLHITQHDLAEVFGVSEVTLQKLEKGTSKDQNTLKLLEIYLTFPEVSLWQIIQNGNSISAEKVRILMEHFQNNLITLKK